MAVFRFRFPHIRLSGVAFAASLAFTSTASAQRVPATPDSLFAHLMPSHPRLILTEAALQTIRDGEAADGDVKEAIRYIRKRADSLMGAPPCAYLLQSGSLLETSREILERTFILGFIANLDRSAKYADRGLQELDAASRFPDWNPARFLDAAEMAAAFAIGYDWLYFRATPAQRSALLQALKTKAFDPAAKEYEQAAWWVNSKSNWNAVCNGGIAMAALSAGNDLPIAKTLLHRSLLSLQGSGALNAYAPDGAYAEGIGYWSYSCQYLAMLFGSLQTALNDEFGMSRLPGLEETGLFPIYLEGPSGRMVNFGDSKDAAIYPYWMSGFALHFKKPLYAWYALKHNGLHVLDILWYDPKAKNAGPESLPLSKRFRGPELAVFRGSWIDTNASYLAFKAGNPFNEHSHLDVGSFTFDALGKRWAMDLGSDSYSLPGYFMDYTDTATRYSYYRLRAEGNNTLTFNPGKGFDQDLFPGSSLIRFDADKKIAVGDLSTAYSGPAEKVLRGVALQAGGRALIQDEFQLRAPGEVWWRMHTEAAISVAAGGRSAMLSQGGKRLWISLLGPADGTVLSSLKAEPLSGTPNPAGQNPNTGISVLAVRLTQVRQGRIAIWMVPLREGESTPTQLPPVEALDSPSWNPGLPIVRDRAGAEPFRFQRVGEDIHAISTGLGPFRIRMFDLQGLLLDEIKGQGPGTYILNPGTAAHGPVLLDVRTDRLRRSILLAPL